LLRGARQVGKTETVRYLAGKFENYIEINFDENEEIHAIFNKNLTPDEICENLSVIYNIPIIEGSTLIFFDEIQSCLPALHSLRYFYEKKPGLHIVSAGSLLEFALSEIASFGVGRIRSVFMYPLSFDEFLIALSKEKMLDLRRKAGQHKPLTEPLHNELLKLLQKFIMLGGMPEVIANYIETGDINECRRIIDDLIFSYQDDFAKYKDKFPVAMIREVFDSVVMQSGGKFVYSKAGTANHAKIKEALNLLILAGLVIPVKHTAANGIPLGAEINSKKQKMLLLDTGIFLRILDFDIAEYLLSYEFSAINKGNVAEMFVGLEIKKYRSPFERTDLFYWHREAKNSNAEVDYLVIKDGHITPIEVKAGTKGAMQSMFLFMKEKKIDEGIRISTENFSRFDQISVYPLYSVNNLIS
ncbi:MAG: ATP-binding protein, partial [Candidatus Delongbacteria bacterium]|nr:ATP-binding protein [Candidatus Delongbacteria bacterium]MCG2760275.1 ATP-binding protein [Candidatus Delongbacteria bacterium]